MTYFNSSELAYLRQIGVYSDKAFINNDEMIKLIVAYRKTLDAKVLDKIIKQCIKLVVFTAKKYKRPDVDVGDLVHQGLEGVIEAVESYYDITAEEKFITYIKIVVDRRMKDCIEDLYQTIRLPKNISSRQAQIKGGTIEKTETDFLHSKINLGTAHDYKEVCKLNSIDEIIDPETDLMQESLQFDVFRVLDTVLNNKEREVIIHSFGLNGENSKSLDLISDIVHLTRQGVGALRERALTKIKSDVRCVHILSKYLE